MRKYLPIIASCLLVSSVAAESQDIYIGGSVSSHELDD